MKQYEFIVHFEGKPGTDPKLFFMAFSPTEAAILAKAERIRYGKNHKVLSVECEELGKAWNNVNEFNWN